MMTLEDLSVISWLRILGGLILFLGSGSAIYTFLPITKPGSLIRFFSFTVLFSTGLWLSLLVWFQFFSIKIGLWFAIVLSGIGWAIAIYRSRRRFIELVKPNRLSLDFGQVLLVVICIATFAFSLWNSRHFVTGLGSDSYHHTLIAQMIADQGKIPENYLPLAPIVTFSYHFGFHAVAAFVSWFSDVPMRLLVVLSGPVLLALAALSVGLLTTKMVKSAYAGAFAAAITGLIFQFPTYMLNWGRYPQLFGLALLPVLLTLFLEWFEDGLSGRYIPFIALAAVGQALVHYRVTIMAGLAVLVLAGTFLIFNRRQKVQLLDLAARLVLTGVLTIVLASAWLWHVYSTQQTGYPIVLPSVSNIYYSFARTEFNLGKYPLGIPVLGLSAAALVIGLFRKDRVVWFLAAWTGILLISTLRIFSGWVTDLVSITISLFIPISISAGWLVWQLIDLSLRHKLMLPAIIFPVFMLGLSFYGGSATSDLYTPQSGFVTRADIDAMNWIGQNTPVDATFMVNTLHFSFSESGVIGSDAGYWLPYLAGRKTVTIPMSYSIERMQSPDTLLHLAKMDKINNNFTSQQAVQELRLAGVSYVYLGEIGGRNNPSQVKTMLQSPDYQAIYLKENIGVFQLLPPG